MGKKRKPLPGDTYSERLANQLYTLRINAGFINHDAFAAAITKAGYELSGSTIGHWELGRSMVHWDAIPAIAKALKVSVHDLLPPK